MLCSHGCVGGIMLCSHGCAGGLKSFVTVCMLMLTYKSRSTDVAVLYVAILPSVRYGTEEVDKTEYASSQVLKITQQDVTEHYTGRLNENDDVSCSFLRATSRSTR
jgi:hypothetical protein